MTIRKTDTRTSTLELFAFPDIIISLFQPNVKNLHQHVHSLRAHVLRTLTHGKRYTTLVP